MDSSATAKNKTNPEQPWKRYQRPDGESILQLGDSHLDKKTLDRLIAQVKRDYKGRSLPEKVKALKTLIEQMDKGEASIGLPGGGRGSANYLQPFREAVAKLPKSFDEFVSQSAKQAGDRLLHAAKKSGYGVEGYNVARSGEYSQLLTQGAGYIVYHQYCQHADHGEELLRRLQANQITIPYELAAVATSVVWDDKWGKEPEVQIEKEGERSIGRSVQFALAFKPETDSDAEKLVKFFERNAKHGGKEAISHSWCAPDIRSSEKVGAFDQTILNVQPVGEFELLILRKEAIPGFRAQPIWINKDLSKLVKALAIYRLAPFARPLVFKFGKSINLNRLIQRNGFFESVKLSPRELGIRLVVKASSLLGHIKPGHKYTSREGAPGHYQYQYPEDDKAQQHRQEVSDVLREERSRGRVPPPSKEVIKERLKKLSDMRNFLGMPWPDFKRILDAAGIVEGEQFNLASQAWNEFQKGRRR